MAVDRPCHQDMALCMTTGRVIASERCSGIAAGLVDSNDTSVCISNKQIFKKALHHFCFSQKYLED